LGGLERSLAGGCRAVGSSLRPYVGTADGGKSIYANLEWIKGRLSTDDQP